MNSLKIKLSILSFITQLLCVNTFFGQTSYTFTPAGATGTTGPSQTMVNNSYSSTSLNSLVTVSLGIQSWTVPTTGNYSIQVYGAKGGNSAVTGTYTGGNGALMSGQFSLTAGSVLRLLVGQKGLDGTYAGYYPGGGGGGGSFIALGSTLVIAAGGGGGAGVGDGGYNGFNGNPGITTTTGNVANGTNSYVNGVPGNSGGGGTGGSWYSGGGGGGYSSNGTNTGSGSLGVGGTAFNNGGNGGLGGYLSGTGGSGGFGGGAGAMFGGGGGGGYSGGAGGTHGGNYNATAGGGGGSYNSGTNQNNTAGANSGDGYIVITRLAGVSIVQTASISCYGQASAALTATAIGGTAPYSYYWSTGSSASSISGLGAGIYSCSSTDANFVVFTSTFAVVQPAPLSTSVSAQNNLNCYGYTNGSASVNAYGGTSPYTYTWTPTGGNSSSASGLSAGAYTVNIKDANNCTTSQIVNLTQPAALNIVGFAINPAFCAGGTTTLVAGGAITYTWSHGVTNGVGFSPAASAVYTVYGTGVNGCVGNNTVAVTVYTLPAMSITGSQSLCAGSSITISGNGASSYSWNTGATSQAISVSPSSATNYTVLGTNSFGCSSTATTNISVFALPTLSTSISNTLICSGNAAVLFAVGANTYTWTGGVTNGLPFYPTTGGTYTVTGAFANGCSNTAVQTIGVTAGPTIAFSGNASICQGNSTTITAGGALTYTWNTGANTSSISISPGSTTTYSVSGTNAAGCVGSAYTSVLVNTPPVLTAYAANSVVCSGIPVNLNVVGGASTYTWLPGNSNSANVSVSPSSNTTYTVFGTSSAGCIGSATTSVVVFGSPTLAISSVSAICLGQTISMTVSGANSYTWSNGSNAAILQINPVSTTVYSVTGIDANGCIGSSAQSILVNPLPSISAQSSASLSCPGSAINLVASGASTYTWLPMGSNSNLTSVSPTSNTTYTVLGASVQGCVSSATVIVNVSPTVSLTVSANSTICAGASATLNAAGASTYSWSNLNTGSSIIVHPMITTTYSVTGANMIGCTTMTTVMVNVTPLPILSIMSPTAVCIGSSAIMVINGANTYSWSTGATSSSISVSPVSTSVYNVIGTDLTGCSSTLSHTLQVVQLPLITAFASNSIICAAEPVYLNANGGNNYSWSNGASGAVVMINPTVSASYTVTGTGVNNCSNIAVVTLSVNECTGISKQESPTGGVVIYPNPSNGNFKMTAESNMEFTILNELGQIILTDRLDAENDYTIQISNQAAGVYFIRAYQGDKVFTQKLIISK